LPESQLDRDLDRIDFAMTELPEGSYCKLRVEYGRYQSALAEQAFDEPYPIQTSAPIEGRTYDPRGLWLAERRTLVEWMGRCEERYDDERLSLALELAEQDPRTEGRPPDIRYTVAALLNRQAEKA